LFIALRINSINIPHVQISHYNYNYFLGLTPSKLKSKWYGSFTIKPYGVIQLMDPSSEDSLRS